MKRGREESDATLGGLRRASRAVSKQQALGNAEPASGRGETGRPGWLAGPYSPPRLSASVGGRAPGPGGVAVETVSQRQRQDLGGGAAHHRWSQAVLSVASISRIPLSYCGPRSTSVQAP